MDSLAINTNEKSDGGRNVSAFDHLDESHLALLEAGMAPVFILCDDAVVFANSALLSLLETHQESIAQQTLVHLFHPEDYERFCFWLTEDKKQGRTDRLSLDLRIATQEDKYHAFSTRLHRGTLHGRDIVLGFLKDMEGPRQSRIVEQQLQQSQKMEALGRLAGGVAHDMNNTLGAIMGFASVLQAEARHESVTSQDLTQILKACKKGKDLMLNLLGFARRGKYRREQFELMPVLEDVVQLLKHSIPKKIRLMVQCDEPGFKLFGDSTQIHHAIMNLCINAVDSIGKDRGTIRILVDTEYLDATAFSGGDVAELESGEYIRIRVQDTGKGMGPEVADMAFEPFFSTKPPGKGTGLGLPMVYGTARNHGGAVIMESIVDEGTTVSVLLPRSRTQNHNSSYPCERRTPSSVDAMTILLIDDEEMVRRSGERVLRKLGYKVFLAEDGADGIRQFLTHRTEISLVILDLMMPVMDGEETFGRLRDICDTVPILLSSGYSKEEKADGLLSRGADAFIQKPFDMDELKRTLATLL